MCRCRYHNIVKAVSRARGDEIAMAASDLSSIGQSVRRKRITAFSAPDIHRRVSERRQTWAYFLRSPHAHARIRGIDSSNAKSAQGVVAIFTGDDLTGVNGLPCVADHRHRRQADEQAAASGAGARQVRYVGDGVALVIARRWRRQGRRRADRRRLRFCRQWSIRSGRSSQARR